MKLYPVLRYDDANAAMDFLERALGAKRGEVHEGGNGGVAHAELAFLDGTIMLSSTSEGDPMFNQGAGRTTIYAAVDEVDSLHERATGAGAEIVMSLRDTDYGSRDFTLRDPEGNLWSFGTYGA
jgi:uncharacterized glyoxalase superfamily protein PhnB